VATPVAANIRKMFSANTAFFRLMQGFLALGLLVGITGLGVVMVRAVRERRRTIGVLRALGFRASTVRRSFLMESGIIALEGIVLGVLLGVLTTWLMYQKSAAFDGVRNGFPIVWGTIGLLAAATFVASLLATSATGGTDQARHRGTSSGLTRVFLTGTFGPSVRRPRRTRLRVRVGGGFPCTPSQHL
jgi:putative ABC transport system permease protein